MPFLAAASFLKTLFWPAAAGLLACAALTAPDLHAQQRLLSTPASGAAPVIDVRSSASTVLPVITSGEAADAAAPGTYPVITIGVPDSSDLGRERPVLISTIERLSRLMPGTQFRLETVLTADDGAQLKQLRPDFMFVPVGLDAVWQRAGIESFRIAARKTALAREAAQSVGSVFVALKNRTDLSELKDLRGKRVVAGRPDSLPGWLAALGEIKRQGFDPETFFGSRDFLFEYYPEIIASLWGGKADAVVLPTCMLESLEATGLAAVGELKVINDRSDAALACRRSTDLYPDMSFAGFSWTPEKMVRDVTAALMTQDPGQGYEWLPWVSHTAVDALYRTLEAGPYAYLRDFSLSALYERHKPLFWALAVLLASMLVYAALLQVLVRRRTRELTETLAEQRRMEAEAREHRRRLGNLERRNIVNQMSGMIAHEINSPVGAICNFKAILDMMLPEQTRADANVRLALDGIESEAQRIAGIVGRVRAYAKQQKHAHKPCDLVEICRRAVRALYVSSNVRARVREHYAVPKAEVMGDSLELELLVLNLLRNASEVRTVDGRAVVIDLTVRGEDAHFCIEVEDNGEPLTDEALGKLATRLQSVKPEGLGMGLSIVRGIADSHSARLVFARSSAGGLRVIYTQEAC